jgi:hypothetical protein
MIRWLILIFCFSTTLVSGQTLTFRGILYNRHSRAPVPEAHIRIRNSDRGTVSNSDGAFSLPVSSLPVSLDISCVGYESLPVEISKIQERPVTLLLDPKIYDLSTVTISDKPVVAVYRDDDYSVLDYAFSGNNLMLLVFRYQLKRSEIILMTPDGDTLAAVHVPAGPPLCLYTDVFSNVHYITKKDEAFQSVWVPVQNQLIFPYRTTYDTIRQFLGGYSFMLKNRLYFQEHSSKGFMTSIGYYSHDEGRKFIRRSADFGSMKKYYADAVNYHTIRPIPDPIDENESRDVDAGAMAYEQMYKKKSCGELFRASDTLMAFFNFCENRIEIMDADGRLLRTHPMEFPADQTRGLLASVVGAFAGSDLWKWDHRLIQDKSFHHIYAVFTRNGLVRLKKIDPESGTLSFSADLPYAFPEKITVFKGEVYFLSKGYRENERWKLFKVALR